LLQGFSVQIEQGIRLLDFGAQNQAAYFHHQRISKTTQIAACGIKCIQLA